ncbi:hypothetical protein MUG91_G5738n1 [Manis pentadactyla]|nr:hypothetical protein MUG91_G5738n1 [Manis pentadactyla]
MMWTRSQIDLGTYSDVRVNGQVDIHHHGVASETSMLTLRFQVKGPVLRLGFSGNGQNELQEYGEELQTLMLIVCSGKVNAEDMVMDRIRYNSDVRTSLRSSQRVKGVIVDINVEGNCAIQFQDYCDARVIFMLMVEFQDTEGNGLECELQDYGRKMTDIDADGGVFS